MNVRMRKRGSKPTAGRLTCSVGRDNTEDGDQLQDSTMVGKAMEYWSDAWQRSVLTLDALNERGNIHLAQAAKEVPNVLNFAN